MYEHCPEAHAQWLKAEEGRKMSRDGVHVSYVGDRKFDPGDDQAKFYDVAAHKAWQAHKIGKCSCDLRHALERKRTAV